MGKARPTVFVALMAAGVLSAAARLVDEGHLLRVWRRNAVADDTTVVGLYAADSEAELDGLLGALPLAEWMQVTVIPLAPHPNDPAGVAPSAGSPSLG